MRLAALIVATLICGSVSADGQIVGPTVTEQFVHSRNMGKDTALPALVTICAKLGVKKVDCGLFAVSGLTQIDKSLWYIGTSSSPDNDPTGCYGAVAIGHYIMWDGKQGTTYACLAPPEDDEITRAELRAIARHAEHLNSIGRKTLQDHEAALYIKSLAKQVSKP